MDYRELAEDLLQQARAQDAAGAEVVVVEDESFAAQVRMRDVDTVKSSREKRLGLRLCFGARSASTATSDFSRDSLRRLLDETVAMAHAVAQDPASGLPEAGQFADGWPDLELWDGEAAALPIPERIHLATAAEAAALDRDPRIVNSEGGDYEQREASVLLANSAGFQGTYRVSRVGLSVTPVAEQG